MADPKPVALISAAASGIGLAVARSLVAEGYSVFTMDSNETSVHAFRAEFGERAAVVCNVADSQQIDTAFDSFKQAFDRLDVLVNNAGVAGPIGPVEDINVTDWQQTIDINLNSMFYLTRLAIPLMKQQRSGAIINMSSNAGLGGCPFRSPYVASKWAAIGLAKTWAMELGAWNIRANALCPGAVNGPRIDRVIQQDALARGISTQQLRQVYEGQNSLNRFVETDDIAAMVCFLISEAGRNISGQAIAIDGHTETLADHTLAP